MPTNLHKYHRIGLVGRSMLKETDLTCEEFLKLVSLGGQLRREKRLRFRLPRLAGRRIVLIFEKTSTHTRSVSEADAMTKVRTSPTWARASHRLAARNR